MGTYGTVHTLTDDPKGRDLVSPKAQRSRLLDSECSPLSLLAHPECGPDPPQSLDKAAERSCCDLERTSLPLTGSAPWRARWCRSREGTRGTPAEPLLGHKMRGKADPWLTQHPPGRVLPHLLLTPLLWGLHIAGEETRPGDAETRTSQSPCVQDAGFEFPQAIPPPREAGSARAT